MIFRLHCILQWFGACAAPAPGRHFQMALRQIIRCEAAKDRRTTHAAGPEAQLR